MLKKLSFLLAALSTLVSSAQAITVSVSKGTGVGINVLSSTDALLSVAQYNISVGTFDGAPLLNLSNFRQFGTSIASTAPQTPTVNNFIAGSFTVAGSAIATPANFNTQPIFIVVTNAAGTERGILGRGTGATNTWVFPSDVANADLISLTLDVNSIGRVAASFGTMTDSTSGPDTLKLVSMAPIPEPGSVVLTFLALGTVFIKRRR